MGVRVCVYLEWRHIGYHGIWLRRCIEKDKRLILSKRTRKKGGWIENWKTDRVPDGSTDRRADLQTDGRRDREKETQTDTDRHSRQRDRQTDRQTDREIER